MKHKTILTVEAFIAILIAAMAQPAAAAGPEYSIGGVKQPDYYSSTNYDGQYGAQYNYGGSNAVDYEIPELPYGRPSITGTGPMEKVILPGVESGTGGVTQSPVGVQYGERDTPKIPDSFVIPDIPNAPGPGYTEFKPTAFTNVSEMYLADGSIGTLSISALGISMKIWEGETNASMAKGLGHYSSTSGWDGNVGVCGHNRGARYTIGQIKDLSAGALISLSTVYGERIYAVTSVNRIANNDWSYLQPTSDNRITLTTCLAGQPALRVCVQAVEVTSS